MEFKHKIEHEEIVNGIIYRTFREDEIEKGVEFYFDVFLKGEPSTKSFGGYKERHPAIIEQIREIIKHGVSLIAIDPSNGDKMVGFRTALTVERGDPSTQISLEDLLKIYPATYACLMHLLDSLVSPDDILNSHPEVNKVYDMFALACHPDYRGRGIATELIRQAFKVAKSTGCNCAIVVATNDLTRKIFDKLGFQRLKQIEWEDCHLDGKPVFVNVESSCATSHFISL